MTSQQGAFNLLPLKIRWAFTDHPRSLALTIVVAYYRILRSRSLTIHVKQPRSQTCRHSEKRPDVKYCARTDCVNTIDRLRRGTHPPARRSWYMTPGYLLVQVRQIIVSRCPVTRRLGLGIGLWAGQGWGCNPLSLEKPLFFGQTLSFSAEAISQKISGNRSTAYAWGNCDCRMKMSRKRWQVSLQRYALRRNYYQTK